MFRIVRCPIIVGVDSSTSEDQLERLKPEWCWWYHPAGWMRQRERGVILAHQHAEAGLTRLQGDLGWAFSLEAVKPARTIVDGWYVLVGKPGSLTRRIPHTRRVLTQGGHPTIVGEPMSCTWDEMLEAYDFYGPITVPITQPVLRAGGAA